MADIERVAVLGSDGYTGWPLTCHLLGKGYDVIGVDRFTRRAWADSVTPIVAHQDRAKAAREHFAGEYQWYRDDITDPETVFEVVRREPDAIVNLAQIPAAPYSMQDLRLAWATQENNIRGALNLVWALHESEKGIPLIQLATMGEYGTPDAPLPEGFLDDGRPAPKSPGSFYHASKVNATVNTRFASETWGLPATEIYQGIVYGLNYDAVADERLVTRFDVDETWGTVLNRFTAQAVAGEPLTVYGAGGQKRAMLSLADCIQCLTLAIENPPDPDGPGRYPYRAINQFDEAYRVRELAEMVAEKTGADIEHVDNPRVEDDSDHFYEPERSVLDSLGYEPTRSIESEVDHALDVVERYSERIPVDELQPATDWRGEELKRESVTPEV